MIRLLLFGVFVALSSILYGQDGSYYSFIENNGQWPDEVLYKCELEDGNLFIENNGLTYDFYDYSEIRNLHGNPKFDSIIENENPSVKGHVYRVSFLDNNFTGTTTNSDTQTAFHNYYIGDDENKWASHCSLYGEVELNNLYPNIDFKYYSEDFFLKYDFIIHSGANTDDIRLKYDGMDDLYMSNGRLIVSLVVNEIIEQKPYAYQEINGKHIFVPCQYELENDVVSFSFPDGYDHDFDLIIDPQLIFSTYSGSTSDNFGYTATYDSQGFLYSGSSVFGNGYPSTTGFYQEDWAGGDGSGSLAGTDIAITKYDTTGTFMVYSTYLGGSSDELPHSLIVDEQDQLFVFGTTSSEDFPTTTGSYSEDFNGGSSFAPGGVGVDYVNGSDIIVSKFSADGTNLLASTYIGGDGNDGVNTASGLKFNYADEMRGEILIDLNGDVLIASCTYSSDFPIVNGFQEDLTGDQEACILKMSDDLETIIWSTFIGGSDGDAAYSLDINSDNDIYVCGGTESDNFYIAGSPYQNSNNGGDADGFILKISEDGTNIPFSTFYGSDLYDQIYFVEIDVDDSVYIYGQTRASGDTFIDNAAYGEPDSGMLISKFTPDLSSRDWSTVFGTGSGKPNLSPTAFLVDDCGRVYMSGWGGSTNVNSTGGEADFVTGMDVTDDAFQSTTTGSDFYLLVLDSNADNIIYGSFFGGSSSSEHVDGGTSRFSPDGTVYQSVCAGCGSNDDFPIFPADAVSSTNNSTNCNNGVFKMKFEIPLVLAEFISLDQYCVNEPVPFINQSESADAYIWNFGDGSPEVGVENPAHSYSETGIYEITLLSFNNSCAVLDSVTHFIEIIESMSMDLGELDACNNGSVVLGPEDINSEYDYNWLADDLIENEAEPNPEVFPTEEVDFTLLISHDGCVDTLYQSVEIVELELSVPEDIVLCDEDFVDLDAIITTGADIIWSDEMDFSNILNDDLEDTDINYFVAGEQTLYAQAIIGDCIEMDEVTITLLASQAETEADITACANDTITVSVLNPNSSLDYSWSPSTNIISGQNTSEITIVVSEEITYTVTVVLNSDCIVTDEITVSVSGVDADQIFASADPSIIYTGESSQLEALPLGLNYTWSPSEDLNNSTIDDPIATPSESTWYNVFIADGACIYKDSVLVEVVDFICGNPTVYLPNAFTPNSNDQNEVLFIRGNNLTSVHLVIFDRWGKKIFETTNQSQGWDGTYEGEELDPAVFVYHMDVVCADGQVYFEKGNITLIR